MNRAFASAMQEQILAEKHAAQAKSWVVRGFPFAPDLQAFLRQHAVTPDQIVYLTETPTVGFTLVVWVPTATARRMEGGSA